MVCCSTLLLCSALLLYSLCRADFSFSFLTRLDSTRQDSTRLDSTVVLPYFPRSRPHYPLPLPLPPLPLPRPPPLPRAADTDNPSHSYACELSHVRPSRSPPVHTKPYQAIPSHPIPKLSYAIHIHNEPVQRHPKKKYQAIIPIPYPYQAKIQSQKASTCTQLVAAHARLLLAATPPAKKSLLELPAGPPRRAQPEKNHQGPPLVQPSPAAHALPTHLPRSRR